MHRRSAWLRGWVRHRASSLMIMILIILTANLLDLVGVQGAEGKTVAMKQQIMSIKEVGTFLNVRQITSDKKITITRISRKIFRPDRCMLAQVPSPMQFRTMPTPWNASSSTRNGLLEILQAAAVCAACAGVAAAGGDADARRRQPFQHPDWIGAWLESDLHRAGRLRLLALRHHGELIAVLPLVWHAPAAGAAAAAVDDDPGPAHGAGRAGWRALALARDAAGAAQAAHAASSAQLPAVIHELAPAAEALPAGQHDAPVLRSKSAWLDRSGDTEQALARVQRSFSRTAAGSAVAPTARPGRAGSGRHARSAGGR